MHIYIYIYIYIMKNIRTVSLFLGKIGERTNVIGKKREKKISETLLIPFGRT
jgi:hypothetical protein